MGDVKFDEQVSYKPKAQSGESGMTTFLIKIGIVKDASSARVVLLIITVICIAISLFLFKSVRDANQLEPSQPPAGFTE